MAVPFHRCVRDSNYERLCEGRSHFSPVADLAADQQHDVDRLRLIRRMQRVRPPRSFPLKATLFPAPMAYPGSTLRQ